MVTRVTMERRPQGRPRNDRFLDREVELRREQGEADDDLIDAVATEVLEHIERHAEGSPWVGLAHLMNDNASKKSERVLASVNIRINEGAEVATAETESVAILQTVRVFMGDMLAQMVKVMGAAAAREAAMATMVESVAKWASKGEQRDARYEWKKTKAEQETERQRISEIGRTQRQKERWAGVADLGSEYKDVVAAWSDFLLTTVKEGKAQERKCPSPADVLFVFDGHDDLLAAAAEMVVTPDRKTRIILSKRFKSAFHSLPAEQQRAIGLRALQRLGSEAAVRAALAWLFGPLSDPPT
jgi:hypothetical protein